MRLLIAAGVFAAVCGPLRFAGAQGEVHTHWESFKPRASAPSVDQGLRDPVLIGAIDLHVHHGPDAYPRQWDAFDAADIAASRGMRGILIKNHWTETAGLAALVRARGAGELEVFGGLALNTTVGGMNAQALRYMIDVDGGWGRVVWMPTHDSEHEVGFNEEQRRYVPVSENGRLLPETLDIINLLAEHELTLATGHVTPAEALSIMREARARGVERLIVTHPRLGAQYTYMSNEELREAVSLGGKIEVTAGGLYRGGPGRERSVELIRTVGAHNAFVASDSGLTGTPNLADALVMAARELRRAGFSENDLDWMFKINPARLLGLPASVDGE